MNKNISLIVSTSERYNELLPVSLEPIKDIFQNFFKSKYILTNKKSKNEFEDFYQYSINESWSSRLIKILNEINEDYIFLTFEDLYFKKFNIDELKKIISYENFNYLRFEKKRYISQIDVPVDHHLRFAALGIWKKEVLKKILRNGENAWEFEINGCRRSMIYKNGFIQPRKNLVTFINIVEKGHLTFEGFLLLKKKEFVSKNFSFSFLKEVIRNIKFVIYETINFLPRKFTSYIFKKIYNFKHK